MTGDAETRLVMATMQIRNNHITAPEQPNEAKLQQAGLSRRGYFQAWLSQLGQRDAEILTQLGFADFAEYWRISLSPETMEKSNFIRLLESHLLDPGQLADPARRRVDTRLEAALEQAMQSDELWFLREVEVDKETAPARLRPREAAGWLLKMYPDLVPLALRAYLETEAPAQRDHKKGRGGRSPELRERVKVALFEKYQPHGQPPEGVSIENKVTPQIHAMLKDRYNYKGTLSPDTVRNAMGDLKADLKLSITKNTQN